MDNTLKENLETILSNQGFDENYTCSRGYAIALMEQAYHLGKQESEADKWVSVEDRLPEEDNQYNVCYRMPNGNWVNFTTGYSLSYNRFDEGNANITHWQPLPNPPQS